MKPITLIACLFFSGIASAQLLPVYKPALASLEKADWANLSRQVDSVELAFPDSILLPGLLIAVAEELYKRKDYEHAKPYIRRMIAFDSKKQQTHFPVTADKKWDYARRIEIYRMEQQGHYYFSEIWFSEQQYDSCLAHVTKAFYGYNYAGKRNFQYPIEFGMHLDYMRSVCLEKLGRDTEARQVLLPYLFLDSINEERDFFDHVDIADRYVQLINKAKLQQAVNDELQHTMQDLRFEHQIPADSLAVPKGWSELYPWQTVSFIRIEGKYVPVVIPIMYISSNRKKPPLFVLPQGNGHRALVVGEKPSFSPADMEYMQKYLQQTRVYKELKVL